jgi:hypothetical protein
LTPAHAVGSGRAETPGGETEEVTVDATALEDAAPVLAEVDATVVELGGSDVIEVVSSVV